MPEEWQALKLKDLVLIRKGKKPLTLSDRPFSNSVPYLDIDAVENNNVKRYADIVTTLLAKKSDIFIVADGSRSGLVSGGAEGAVGSTQLCLTPYLINSQYLLYFLQSKFEYFNNNTKGASIPHLDNNLLGELIVPIPHPDEQEIIVKELTFSFEKYARDFANAYQEIDKVEAFRKSVLDRAITGEITKDWRKKNSIPEDQILEELRSLNDGATVFDKSNFRVKLPSTWLLTNAGSICSKITDGEHSTPTRYSNGEMLLSARNVRNGYIDYENVDFISNDDLQKLRKRCDPEINDVLIVSVGATIGRTAIVTEKRDFALVRSVLLLKPLISGHFLMYVLQSQLLQNIIKENIKGVAQAHLYITETNQLPIPFPSLSEQEEIVKTIQAHLDVADKLELDTDKLINRLIKLKDSINQIAFSGGMSNNRAEIYKNKSWFDEFIIQNTSSRNSILEEIKNENKIKSEKLKKLKEGMAEKISLLDIISQSPNGEISVENAWHQSKHYEGGNIEDFYEELEKLASPSEDRDSVEWFFSDASKNNVFLKVKK